MVTYTLLSVCAHKSDMGLTGLKIKVSARLYFFLENLEETLFPCLLQLPDATYIPWLMDSSLHFQSQQGSISVALLVSSLLSLTTASRLSAFQD